MVVAVRVRRRRERWRRPVARRGGRRLPPAQQVLADQAQTLYGSMGRTAQKANAPDVRRAHLQAFVNDFLTRGGGRPAIVTVGDTGTFQERPGVESTTQVPAAWADQNGREIRFSTMPQLNPAAQRDPAMAHGAEMSQGRILAHESGHMLEPDLVRNYARARQYQEIKGLPMDPLAPALVKTPQGRGELWRRSPARNPWGMPTEGIGGVHQAPNEKYADDVSYAFGFGGQMTPRQKAILRALAAKGLIPKPQSQPNGLPVVRWPTTEGN